MSTVMPGTAMTRLIIIRSLLQPPPYEVVSDILSIRRRRVRKHHPVG
jgi:hypothetical protein